MNQSQICNTFKILKEEGKNLKAPWLEHMVEKDRGNRDPFKVLISCILSLRTQDNTTGEASERLFTIAPDINSMVKVPVKAIQKAIYPVGFYSTKAVTIHNLCKEIINEYNSRVPDNLNDLLELKGVGRKTANLVLTLGYNKYGICVDTHVHRISNRWGYVSTKTPEQTEFALRKKLPRRYWMDINGLLVTFGQNICKPVSPFCSRCALIKYCKQVGVNKHR